MIKSVTVFCASSDKCNPEYLNEASLLGELLAKNNIQLVYGGGKAGLMGKLSEAALINNGTVTGIIPDHLYNLELGNENVTKLIITKDIHERENLLLTISDCIMVLPGGIGTLEEFQQALAWKVLNLIDKPVILINFDNYFDHLLKMLQKTTDDGFMSDKLLELFDIVENSVDALKLIKQFNSKNPYPQLSNLT